MPQRAADQEDTMAEPQEPNEQSESTDAAEDETGGEVAEEQLDDVAGGFIPASC
jgi:hypothetical protein